ncbi:MAG: amidohydrolase family protein [Promethearchaeota archaeon]
MIETIELVQGNNEPRKLNFYLIDGHHHIGEDTDGNKNLTVNGSFTFFSLIWKGLQEKYSKIQELPSYQQPRFKIQGVFPSTPLASLNPENTSRYASSWLFDQFIAFPFHDVFRNQGKKEGMDATYFRSNDRIGKNMYSSLAGGRLIAYCRLDPNDGEQALNELVRSHMNGLKGIKLHPISDGWNTKEFFQSSHTLRKILLLAMRYNMPVLFDCRFTSTMGWIHDLVDEVRTDLIENDYLEAIIDSRLKIIIAHIGFLRDDDSELARILSHPNIYGDLTGQFSDKIKSLIESLKARIKPPANRGEQSDMDDYWSTKVFLGSDYNYFETFHIVDQLLYFLSEDFYELIGGNISILHNIFSGNLIRMLETAIPTKPATMKAISPLKVGFSSIINNDQLNEIISAVNLAVKEISGDGFPGYFRMVPLTGNQFITANGNFYFQWGKTPLILAGIIPEGLGRMLVYLFKNSNEPVTSFETLAIQIMNNKDISIFSNLDNLKESIKEIITEEGMV